MREDFFNTTKQTHPARRLNFSSCRQFTSTVIQITAEVKIVSYGAINLMYFSARLYLTSRSEPYLKQHTSNTPACCYHFPSAGLRRFSLMGECTPTQGGRISPPLTWLSHIFAVRTTELHPAYSSKEKPFTVKRVCVPACCHTEHGCSGTCSSRALPNGAALFQTAVDNMESD